LVKDARCLHGSGTRQRAADRNRNARFGCGSLPLAAAGLIFHRALGSPAGGRQGRLRAASWILPPQSADHRNPAWESPHSLTTQARITIGASAVKNSIRTALAELRRRFEELYGDRLTTMLLYGSQARGNAKPGSDTDVLVVLKGPVDSGREIERTLDIVSDLSLRFNEVITCVFMDDERFARRTGPLLRNVGREGVAV